MLAKSIGKKTTICSGEDDIEWALNISPHLDFTNPYSPSLINFIEGIDKVLTKDWGAKVNALTTESENKLHPPENLQRDSLLYIELNVYDLQSH